MRIGNMMRTQGIVVAVAATLGVGLAEAQTPRLTILARQRVFTATASALADGVFTPGERANIIDEARFDLPPEELMQLQTRLNQLAAQYPSASEREVVRSPIASRRVAHHPSGRQPRLQPRRDRYPSPTLARRDRASAPRTGSPHEASPHAASGSSPGTVRQAAMLLVARPFPVPPMHRPRPEHIVGQRVSIPPAPRVPTRDVSPASFENAEADEHAARPVRRASR